MRLSIRWRLTLWNMLAVAAVLVGFGALVYGLLRGALYDRLDHSLLSEWEELRADRRLSANRDERLRYRIHEFDEHQHGLCVVYDEDGKVHVRTERLAADSVPPPPDAADPPRLFDTTLPLVGRQRALCGALHLGRRRFTVLLLSPLEDVDRALGQLLTALATAGPAALVLGGGLAYLLARKSLAPMEELHRRAEHITADRLDRRLPVANPGDELGRLTRTINAMIGRLEASFAEIRRFTADASHELRTPLAAIRIEAEVALGKPLTVEQHQELLGSILEECERLVRLTDQLLALAREDARGPRPELALVDLAALAAGVVETMRPLAEARRVALDHEPDGPLRVRGEEARLRQVFFNLLDNAIKYTPAGGTVAVGLGRVDGDVVVTVRDTGIGIPAEHLPRVFDRFYRVDKVRSRAEGGAGLGLSIARKIVADHGGRIELTSTPGQGTTCTVRLPLDQPADAKAG
jgi:two-component system, OmpR family, heavy metal sensor histidine kinase CusS